MSSKTVQKNIIFEEMAAQGLTLPYSDDMSFYKKPLSLYGKEIPVRIGIQPLEGFDSDSNGSPTDMVRRRYTRFAKGGAGLIWFEACAVSNDGKSNPYQMSLTDSNVNEFKNLIQAMDQASTESGHKPSF